jgi:hypothetical protein
LNFWPKSSLEDEIGEPEEDLETVYYPAPKAVQAGR